MYRLSELFLGIKQVFDRYVEEVDPLKGSIVEFGEPSSMGDIVTGGPRLRMVFAFSSKEVCAILVQYGENWGGCKYCRI